MKWFKHKTGSLDDPDINELMDEFGDSGYMMFFGLLEIYGREYSNVDSDGFLTLNLAFVARKLRKNSVKVKKFLRYTQEISRFDHFIEGKKVSIRIPKFIDISSNWTKRRSPPPTEVPTEVPTAREVEVEVEEEEERTIVRKPAVSKAKNFNLFWSQYPKKKSKGQAEKAFTAIKPDNGTMDAILAGLEKAKESKDWAEDGGKFIPHPATWLRAKGWEDDHDIHIKQPEVKIYSDI